MEYDIKNGDTLPFLAFRFYGNSLEYKRIVEENPFLEWWEELIPQTKINIPKVERKRFSKELWRNEKKRKERLEEYPGTEELEISNGDFLEIEIETDIERNVEIPRRFI